MPFLLHAEISQTHETIFRMLKHLLRTVVLIKVLVDTRATGCKTQQLNI
jgi:hypothetical protein